MSHARPLSVIVAALLLLISSSAARGEAIAPNIVACDFNFSYAGVSYQASSETLTGFGTYSVTSFEPVLGGSAYPVFNLNGNGGAAIALGALLDHVGTDFDVHGFFTTGPLTLPDLVITGMIPSLGMDGTGGGTLLQAEVIDLELFGDAGTGAYALNGYFRVMGGELVTEGYLQEDDVVGMASWLTTVRPPLPEGFDFTSDFATVTHLGEFGEVPEPATLSLAAVACGAFAVIRRRRRA